MQANDELRELRAAMDVCNRRLAAVLQDRARLARSIGAWKRQRGMPLADPHREAAMLIAVGDLTVAGGFDAEALQRIFVHVFAETRALVERR